MSGLYGSNRWETAVSAVGWITLPVYAAWSRPAQVPALLLFLLFLLVPGAIHAQTDYYNTDAGRPVRIEDAYATERYAFELKVASVRLERLRGGHYTWGAEPEIAYGLLPRTHIELGMPLLVTDPDGAPSEGGVAGLEVSVLHNLNAETRTLPALGLRADLLLPVGHLAPGHAYASGTALLTRTWPFARLHVNARYTAGPTPDRLDQNGGVSPAEHAVETERWLAGIAVDRAFPLSAFLLIAEVYARQPIEQDADVQWHTGAGVRYQLTPRLAVDAGVGRRLTDREAWTVTFGTAWAFGLRALIPG